MRTSAPVPGPVRGGAGADGRRTRGNEARTGGSGRCGRAHGVPIGRNGRYIGANGAECAGGCPGGRRSVPGRPRCHATAVRALIPPPPAPSRRCRVFRHPDERQQSVVRVPVELNRRRALDGYCRAWQYFTQQ
ncbi:hypothetical protein SSCG_01055 [Streptomyces clavuligerus]|nr:hypothetical protein SSCG_01055 [Streptomyces clavuligerus]